jgi:hypothetical protein
MIKHIVEMTLAGSEAKRFYDFMVNPADEIYRQWLPGEHLEFHVVSRGEKSPLGDEIYFDEYLNGRHASSSTPPSYRQTVRAKLFGRCED